MSVDGHDDISISSIELGENTSLEYIIVREGAKGKLLFWDGSRFLKNVKQVRIYGEESSRICVEYLQNREGKG